MGTKLLVPSEGIWSQQYCGIDIYNATWKFQGENDMIQMTNDYEFSNNKYGYALINYVFILMPQTCLYV